MIEVEKCGEEYMVDDGTFFIACENKERADYVAEHFVDEVKILVERDG